MRLAASVYYNPTHSRAITTSCPQGSFATCSNASNQNSQITRSIPTGTSQHTVLRKWEEALAGHTYENSLPHCCTFKDYPHVQIQSSKLEKRILDHKRPFA